MKKLISLMLLLSLVVSCQTQQMETPAIPETAETSQTTPVQTSQETPPIVKTTEPVIPATPPEQPQVVESLKDYFPFNENVLRKFEGHGNEFLEMSVYTEYFKDDLVQFHSSNGGTATVEVYSVTDEQVVLTYIEHEMYHREPMLKAKSPEQGRIILKTPLKVGEVWTNPDGSLSEITQVGAKLETDLGIIDCIVVKNGDSSYFYGKGYGLVRAEHNIGGELLYAQLKEFSKNTPIMENFTMYPISADAASLEERALELPMLTNEILRIKWGKALVETYKGLPSSLQVNSLYKNRLDGMVYADFSKEITMANYGAGPEALMLEGIVDTLTQYFNAEGMYLWVEGGPYESGHILLEKNQLLKPKR